MRHIASTPPVVGDGAKTPGQSIWRPGHPMRGFSTLSPLRLSDSALTIRQAMRAHGSRWAGQRGAGCR